VGVGILGEFACVEFGFMQGCVDCIKPNWRKCIKPNWAMVHKAELGAWDEEGDGRGKVWGLRQD
jgi:hypothetical protein